MALTRDFKKTVKARAERDPEFRVALLEEALGLTRAKRMARIDLSLYDSLPFV